MPTALDRLLASPSALRVLRSIVAAPELPPVCITANNCCRALPSSRRSYASTQSHSSPLPRTVAAAKYGGLSIFQLPDIDGESDVNRQARLRQRRLVSGHDKHAAAEWARLLQYRERVYGSDGVRDIWFGMARFGYSLPTTDTPNAGILWSTFLRHEDIVQPLLDHAAKLFTENRQIYPGLYEKCMAYWLGRNPEKALEYHHIMLVKLRLRRLPLQTLARLVVTSYSRKSLEAFHEIYRTSNERDVYGAVVPALVDKGQIALARAWHAHCLRRRDFPPASVANNPAVQIFTAELSSSQTFDQRDTEGKGTAGHFTIRNVGQEGPYPTKYNKDLQRRLLGRDIAPVRFEDPFCARLFATRAFPPSSIIKGLSMVGVNEVGPQALRAMSVRTDPLSELPQRFRELKENGIVVKPCVFSLALEKFAMEGSFNLVRSILESDQHPDVFEDAAVQRQLLEYYLDRGDLPQLHRTLAILTLFHNDPNTEAWNIILQARIRRFNRVQIPLVLQDMRKNGIMLSGESCIALRGILRRRQRGRQPENYPLRFEFDDLRFVTRAFMSVLESGTAFIPPLAWREIIRRYGMLGRFRELKRLLFWLLYWYAPRNGTRFASLPKPVSLDEATAKLRRANPHRMHYFNLPPGLATDDPSHPLRQLFSPAQQQAFVIWGFRAALVPHAPTEQNMLASPASKRMYRRRLRKKGVLRRLHWSVGLRLLRELQEAGVLVQPYTIVKSMQLVFLNLFGRGRSSKIQNRMMQDENKTSYAEYAQEVNNIWGRTLFQEHPLPKHRSVRTSRRDVHGKETGHFAERAKEDSASTLSTTGMDSCATDDVVPEVLMLSAGIKGSRRSGSGMEELETAAHAQRSPLRERTRN